MMEKLSEFFYLNYELKHRFLMSPRVINIWVDKVKRDIARGVEETMKRKGGEWKLPALLFADFAVIFGDKERELLRLVDEETELLTLVDVLGSVCETRNLNVPKSTVYSGI